MALHELKTTQLMEYKKLLKTVLKGIDSAIALRASLIECDSVSQLDFQKYDSFHDPEKYYHLKLFDKGISICRLYNSSDWFVDDPEKKYFHFCIRCYNFTPNEKYKLPIKLHPNYSDYGDFCDIDDSLKYFHSFCYELTSKVSKILQKNLIGMEIF